jgi:hypothetical protein
VILNKGAVINVMHGVLLNISTTIVACYLYCGKLSANLVYIVGRRSCAAGGDYRRVERGSSRRRVCVVAACAAALLCENSGSIIKFYERHKILSTHNTK